MKNYIKKITFICSGLFIIVGTFVLSRVENVDASTAPRKYGAWTLNCATNNDEKQLCVLSQQINNTAKDKEKEILAIYHIGYFDGEQEEKELKLIEVIPPNVQIPNGTIINSGSKQLAAGKYVNCTINGCQAVATITKDDIGMILSNDNQLVFITSDGKQAKILFIKDGLREGLKALEK